MPTEGQQPSDFIINESARQMRGLEELGKPAAAAVAGIKVIEKVAEAAERKVEQLSEESIRQERKQELTQTGQQIIGTQALAVAEQKKETIQNETETAAKTMYNTMIQQRMEAEEKKKKKQKKQFTVSMPTSSSPVTEVAKSILAPSSMYQFFLPGSGFLGDAIKKIL